MKLLTRLFLLLNLFLSGVHGDIYAHSLQESTGFTLVKSGVMPGYHAAHISHQHKRRTAAVSPLRSLTPKGKRKLIAVTESDDDDPVSLKKSKDGKLLIAAHKPGYFTTTFCIPAPGYFCAYIKSCLSSCRQPSDPASGKRYVLLEVFRI